MSRGKTGRNVVFIRCFVLGKPCITVYSEDTVFGQHLEIRFKRRLKTLNQVAHEYFKRLFYLRFIAGFILFKPVAVCGLVVLFSKCKDRLLCILDGCFESRRGAEDIRDLSRYLPLRLLWTM